MADSTRSPFTLWWAAAGIFLILVLAGGAFIGFQLGRSGGEPETAPTQPPQTNSNGGAAQPAGGCDVPADNQDYPTSAPETQWELYQDRFTMPVSPEFGPTIKDGDFWRCYAHSPTGAVFAGIGLSGMFSVGLVYEAAEDSAGAQQAFETEQNAGGGNQLADVTGFRVDSYSEDAATVTYSAAAGEAEGTMEISLVWDETASDWRLDYSAGEMAFSQDFEESQFTPWGPNDG